MNGASAALMISDIPLPTPVGAVRIGKVEGNFVVNPREEELLENTDLDLVVAGTEEAILMVEAGANEIPEAEILDALDIAHARDQEALRRPARAAPRRPARTKLEVEAPQVDEGLLEPDQGVARRRRSTRPPRSSDKLERQDATKAVEEEVLEQYAGDPDADDLRRVPRRGAARVRQAREGRSSASASPSRRSAPTAARRDEIRPITIEVGVAAAHARLRAVHPRPDAGPLASPRSARSRRRCASTRSAWRRTSATSTTTTSRRSRWARPASCAARSAATSATARSPSARSCR